MTPGAETDFGELGLSASVIETLAGLSYGSPTPFQEQAIPPQIDKRDLCAVVSADSGNDAAYALPVVERILREGSMYGPTALILVPTRELAIEVHETIFQLTSRGTVANVLGVFEGKPVTSQIGPLKHGVDIVVGTPGRTLEHVKRGTLRIEQIKILVLDLADEMLGFGFSREIEAIIESTPKTRQTVILSATAPPRVLSLARKHLRDPELLGIDLGEFASVAEPETPKADFVNLYFGLGKGAGITPRDLVGAITNEGGLSGDQIGSIKIKQNFSLVAVPSESAEGVISRMRSASIKGRKTKVRLERFRAKGDRT